MVVPNPYTNIGTRQLRLVSGDRTKLLDFDSDTGETWQAWMFSNDVNDKSTEFEFVLRGSFGTTGSIVTTIGGGGIGGGLITGTGACEVFATGQDNNLISLWFTPEQTSTSLPPKNQSFVIVGVAGTTFNVGYPPFGRNRLQVQSNGSFVMSFQDDNGNLVNGATLNSNSFSNGFYQPSSLQLILASTNPNQNFNVEYFT